MKLQLLLSAVLALTTFKVVQSSANGGYNCAACSILIGIGEQLAQVHVTDFTTAVESYLCVSLPHPFNKACYALVDRYGREIVDLLYHQETPDTICYEIGFCTRDLGKNFCHAFPLPTKASGGVYSRIKRSPIQVMTFDKEPRKICDIPGIRGVCNLLKRVTNEHLPLEDLDGDRHSQTATLRGTHWRGKDCNDTDANIYPGRKPVNGDRVVDSNCNGIYGTDNDSKKSYEELYCGGSNQLGVVVLGDSASAHFHIPAQYMQPEFISEDTFKDLFTLVTNEGDWPMLSWITAFTDNKWPLSIYGPTESLYKKLFERNRCIHRDYQNIGVNGAKSGSMNGIVESLSRNSTTDYPLLVVLSLIGNDVCNNHVDDTVAHMTTPEDFRKNTMKTLQYLDLHLPKGSKVLLTGLADGRILYRTMHNRFHPLGQLNSDVTYTNVYDYLNCLEVSPCVGWLNSNETLRNLTSQRAAQLSTVASNIVKTETFQNFTTGFAFYDIEEMMTRWEAQGGKPFEVIEPIDGFHPGQIGQSLAADYLFEQLQINYPDMIGRVNPNNDRIKQSFGNQNGY